MILWILWEFVRNKASIQPVKICQLCQVRICTYMYGLQEFDMIPYKTHDCTFFNGMEPYGPCMETHGKIRCRSFM